MFEEALYFLLLNILHPFHRGKKPQQNKTKKDDSQKSNICNLENLTMTWEIPDLTDSEEGGVNLYLPLPAIQDWMRFSPPFPVLQQDYPGELWMEQCFHQHIPE